MDKVFPEEYELLWLFESEPELLDKGSNIPLFYNYSTYHINRYEFEIFCSFQPSYGDMDLTILRNGIKVVDFHITNIIETFVQKEDDKEFLEVHFKDDSLLKPLILYLKPFVCLSWSMNFE